MPSTPVREYFAPQAVYAGSCNGAGGTSLGMAIPIETESFAEI